MSALKSIFVEMRRSKSLTSFIGGAFVAFSNSNVMIQLSAFQRIAVNSGSTATPPDKSWSSRGRSASTGGSGGSLMGIFARGRGASLPITGVVSYKARCGSLGGVASVQLTRIRS